MQSPLVSVIMPYFNAMPYIAESIASILNQTYGNFELILVDDGSFDSSAYVVAGFKDSRLIHLRNETNLGITASLNIGLQMAKGEFIARMDADDVSHAERLQLQIDFLRENPSVDIVSGGIQFSETKRYQCYDYTNDILEILFLFENPISHPTAIWRKQRLLAHHISYDEHALFVEDYKLWIDCILSGLQFRILPTPVLTYRQHESQITKTRREKQFANFLRIAYLYLQAIFPEAVSFSAPKKFYSLVTNKVMDSQELSECIDFIDRLVELNQQKRELNAELFSGIMQAKKAQLLHFGYAKQADPSLR
ncbi:hypothetical protein C7T94_03865 [Pedobacter yulinensis]|uniref:Glycosyltransferase 2-like domain-containing protein n=1 Tax=Pedobacter yulinensis TaxID=2126353 RepID=A0A2T3HN55_9SPHI|nr:glycosyltransferase family 2 protein [Pedobacter yulinensis]PST83892.1 hypothetical protein C7T94_03865 [Pedobacter yulinensis]